MLVIDYFLQILVLLEGLSANHGLPITAKEDHGSLGLKCSRKRSARPSWTEGLSRYAKRNNRFRWV